MMELVDSKIEWIGEIPSDWSVYSLSQVVDQVKNKNKDLEEKNLLSLSYGKIKRKDIESSDGLLPASFDNYNIIEEGDIVLRLTDLQNDHTSLRVGRATERGIITSAYCTIRSNAINSKYLYYLLHAYDIKKGFYGMGSGVRQSLNYSEVRNISIVAPQSRDQDRIVCYLDNILDKIDASIDELKQSVDDYKKLRESLIFETITKGLKTDVSYKQSGVHFIGEIPSEWSVVRLKYLVEGYKAGPFGSSLITGELDEEGSILVYTPEHISKNDTNIEGNLYLPIRREIEMSQFAVSSGDIIFPIVGSLGKAMLITEDMPKGIINQRLAKFRINENKVYLDYFLWMFARSKFYQPFVDVNCRGSIIVNLTKSIVYDMPVVVPNTYEQQIEIAKYLEEKCKIIDEMISEKEASIVDLVNYRNSLIYEVITGKKEV